MFKIISSWGKKKIKKFDSSKKQIQILVTTEALI